MARAEVMVDREPAPMIRAAIVPRQERIQRAAEELQENHDCTHEGYNNWLRAFQGNLTCENCFQTLDRYLLECRQCRLRACVRCIRNRL